MAMSLTMNSKVSQACLGDIADNMTEWEGAISDNLELTWPDCQQIQAKYQGNLKMQKREALKTWSQKKGNDATFQKLKQIFLKAKCRAYADYVDKVFNKEQQERRNITPGPPIPQNDYEIPKQGDRLTIDNSKAVIHAIWDARHKFESIGRSLGIDEGTLSVARQKKDFPEQALPEVVNAWLRGSKPLPTWKALAEALRDKIVGESALGDIIDREHCPSLLITTTTGTSDSKPSNFEVTEKPAKKRVKTDNGDVKEPPPIWCTANVKLAVKPAAGEDRVTGAAYAVAMIHTLWNKSTIGVKFMDTDLLPGKWLLNNKQMVTNAAIISWANTWRRKCGPSVPEFVDVADMEPGNSADIRVGFNEQGINYSYLGTSANDPQLHGKPTMQLSFTYAWNDDLKKHYVMHEFGHALGLAHEHQRSLFWNYLYPHVNIEKMKADTDVGGDENFKQNWAEMSHKLYSTDAGVDPGEYDPHSIMHYGFKVQWLDKSPIGGNDYSILENVEKDKVKLGSKAYDVLCGVHERGGLSLATYPSEEDIRFLTKCYVPSQGGASNVNPTKTDGSAGGANVPPQSSNEYSTKTDGSSGGSNGNVESWSVKEVVDYFKKDNKCNEFAGICEREGVDGEALLDLTLDILKEYHVGMGLAVKVMKRIEKLKAGSIEQ